MRDQKEPLIFLTQDFPFPASSGTKIRDAHFIRLLSERFDVELLCFDSDESPHTALSVPPEFEPIPDDLKVTYIPRGRPPLWRLLLSLFQPSLVTPYNGQMAQALRKRAQPGRLLWISRLGMAQYLPLAHSLGYRVILDEHTAESSHSVHAAMVSVTRWHRLFSAAQVTHYESRYCAEADAVVATSDIDASRLQKLAPKKRVHVIPNAVNSPLYESARGSEGSTLFFSGRLDYPPNAEGLQWFVTEILPKLRNSLGSGLPKIVVAGARPSSRLLQQLQGAGVEVYADPKATLPFLSQASVVFVPLRSRGGTRFKILEAMAAGRAVVSTGKGAEGLVLTPSRDIFIADHADAFATAILRLLRDPELRRKTGEFAVQTVEQRYDWRCARALMDDLLNQLQQKNL